uniref:GLIPR1-like protein 1 n=1 Tax=Ciona intestinalis TaxID=7719 RepID=F6ZF87_CIOIN
MYFSGLALVLLLSAEAYSITQVLFALDKLRIVSSLNRAREGPINASNMHKLAWDDALEKRAIKLVDNCFYSHSDINGLGSAFLTNFPNNAGGGSVVAKMLIQSFTMNEYKRVYKSWVRNCSV